MIAIFLRREEYLNEKRRVLKEVRT